MAANSSPISATANQSEKDQFTEAVEMRRKLVYDYLDNWPGAGSFQPADIHDALFSYVKQRGKALRPALLLFSCGLVGGDEAMAIPAAAAVEIFQIWTLVHDDIIDRDDMRRGNPTVHARYRAHGQEVYGLDDAAAAHYGATVAILAGDLQQSWSYALLSDLASRGVSPEVSLKLISRMAGTLTPTLLEGEMLDVQFSLASPDLLSEDDVLKMLSKKTAALFEYSAWAGATVGLDAGKGDVSLADKLGRFASLCGVAFQLQDDLLGLTADEATLGKPVGSDIREGKSTLVVHQAMARMNAQSRRELLAILGSAEASAADVEHVVALIKETGAYDSVYELANSYISQASEILASLPENKYKGLLRSWASFTLARKF